MQNLFSVALLGAVAAATPIVSDEFDFMKFIAEWNKSYSTAEEYAVRFGHFMRVHKYIKENNAPETNSTHVAAHNKFSDWSEDEFKKLMTLKDQPTAPVKKVTPRGIAANGGADWRTSSCLTPVKDQGQCGSCWAFSATESVESANCIGGNALDVLSPQ